MPEFVRVRVKSTGALIWIDPANLTDAVELLDRQPENPLNFAPVPHVNLTARPADASTDGAAEATEGTPAEETASKAAAPSGKK